MKQFDKILNKLLGNVFRYVAGNISISTHQNEIDKVFNRAYRKYDVDGILSEEFKYAIKRSYDRVNTKKRFGPSIYNFTQNSVLINDLTNKRATELFIKRQIRAVNAWKQKATAMVDNSAIQGNIAKDVSRLLQNARAAIVGGDTSEYMRYRQKVLKRINKLVDPTHSRLRAAYLDVVKLTENSSQKQFDRAVRYAIKEKARSNAERIVLTETNRAYNQGVLREVNSDPDVVAVKWKLSDYHPKYDECNFFANQDLCGMGTGIYPKDMAPQCPIHPNCNCILEPVYKTEIKNESGEWSQKRIDKAYDKLSEKSQKSIHLDKIKGVKYK